VTLDEAIVAEYADAMAAGAEFPPVVVFFDGTARWLADGWHRVKAAERLGLATLTAEVHQGTRRDATLFAIGANQTHGLRRTNADKRKVVLTLLGDKQWRRWSDRELARRSGVGPDLVGALRSASIGNRQIEPRTVERNGRTYEMDTAPIGKRLSSADSQTPLALDGPSPDVIESPSRLAVHYSSESVEHYTPATIIEAVVACFGVIDLDPCGNSEGPPNVPAQRHLTSADDGLTKPWAGRVYMNPPYGREIERWVAKLCDEHEHGEVIEAIALLPARTDTQWFQRLRDYACCFVEGRLTFIGNNDPAPFPSALFYLGEDLGKFHQYFKGIGDVWQRIMPGISFGE
jgi:hypothetical protein